MKKVPIYSALFFFLFTFPYVVSASNIKGGENVNISSPVDGNLYAGGGKVYINAKISGDLICGGGEITLRDSILEDAALAGGRIDINGNIKGDLRIGGGEIIIRSNIDGDLVVAGGDVKIEEGVVIGGDMIVAGGSVVMSGTVKGNIEVAGGEIEFSGMAENNFSAKAGDLTINGQIRGTSSLSAETIQLGEDAGFYGNVEYWRSDGEMDFGGKLKAGANAVYSEDLRIGEEEFAWQYLGLGFFLFWVIRLLAAALMIVVLIWLFDRFFAKTVDNEYQNYLKKLGIGLLFIIATPVAILLTLVTIIGIPLGLTAMMVYIVAMALAHMLASVLGSYELQRRSGTVWTKGKLMLVAIGIFALLKILVIIPFLGWLLSLIVAGLALGSLWLKIVNKPAPAEMV